MLPEQLLPKVLLGFLHLLQVVGNIVHITLEDGILTDLLGAGIFKHHLFFAYQSIELLIFFTLLELKLFYEFLLLAILRDDELLFGLDLLVELLVARLQLNGFLHDSVILLFEIFLELSENGQFFSHRLI